MSQSENQWFNFVAFPDSMCLSLQTLWTAWLHFGILFCLYRQLYLHSSTCLGHTWISRSAIPHLRNKAIRPRKFDLFWVSPLLMDRKFCSETEVTWMHSICCILSLILGKQSQMSFCKCFLSLPPAFHSNPPSWIQSWFKLRWSVNWRRIGFTASTQPWVWHWLGK